MSLWSQLHHQQSQIQKPQSWNLASLLSLLMTKEQRLAVQAFFDHREWDYVETNTPGDVRQQDYECEVGTWTHHTTRSCS